MYLRGQKTATSECECERGPSKCEEVTIGEGGGGRQIGGGGREARTSLAFGWRGGGETRKHPRQLHTYIHTYVSTYIL